MTPLRRAWSRLVHLETKYDRNVIVSLVASVAIWSAWLVARLIG